MKTIKSVVGHDSDSAFGKLLGFLIVACVVIAIIVYGGAIIGGFYAIRNYALSFWHNVVDSNKKVPVTAQ